MLTACVEACSEFAQFEFCNATALQSVFYVMTCDDEGLVYRSKHYWELSLVHSSYFCIVRYFVHTHTDLWSVP